MKSFIQAIASIGNKNIRINVLNGVYWIDIKTPGLLISAFWNEIAAFGKIEFNNQYWQTNEGSSELPADMWSNILANCIGLMKI